ncbi:unnamed protein product [Spirodela intermedia]|uniref:Chorein N-terminal domain-containing protein n=1 Tax=Spirodela intermedia TaxID=51605 RepID=A0A7I8LLE9_SPIIN|nr:unnamed protein product [Spirodela intermedia]
MFEGFVSQVLAGYLGRYVKGIQKDQLKIGIWNEEVLLDNVELILEAFDYLQLPFALKQGKIGKLSIRIPWKKLGWDPIVIVLEDVFFCACSRGSHDWSLASVEKRELAGKMAKLNAAELAKFSKRVYGNLNKTVQIYFLLVPVDSSCFSVQVHLESSICNQVGQSFFAKILDNIQVSIKNLHIVYIDTHADPERFIFGLRFSSLTIMTDTRKQNSIGSSYGKFKGGQVKKILKISTCGIYCNLFDDNISVEDDPIFTLCYDSKFEPKRYDYLINPFDLTVSLLVCCLGLTILVVDTLSQNGIARNFENVNKSGMFDASPEYSVMAELTSVVVLLNEVQLLQILSLWDHFSICSLRESFYGSLYLHNDKEEESERVYGRYRPDHTSLSWKVDGWQILWWHYAQQSVLADVRRRLRKTSWSSLGRRMYDRVLTMYFFWRIVSVAPWL